MADRKADERPPPQRAKGGGDPGTAKDFGTLADPETLRELVHKLQEGLYITNRDGVILDANPAFLAMFGIKSLGELRSSNATDLIVDPEQRRRELEILDRDGAVREYELQIRRPDGQVRTVLDSCFASTRSPCGETLYHGILVDITQRKELEHQLTEQSVRDPLTGCYNRRWLAEFERRRAPQKAGWGCIVLDVDGFKEYNDRYGHEVGDEVLVRVARFLMRQTRAQEGVVRLGGDEFLVLLTASNPASVETAANRLKQAGARQVPVAFSLGWAAREDEERLERTIARADHNLLAVRAQRPAETERRRG